MPLSLSNRKDIIANSLGVISESTIVDVGDNIVSVVEQLESKAPKTTVYTKQETYTRQQVNALLDNVEDENIDAQLELKADIDDVNAALLLKRDKSDSYTIARINNLLEPKATTAYVDAGLNLKANQITTHSKSDTDQLLNPKATITCVDAGPILKANGTDVYIKIR